jgi:Domain of unknown function (DUF6815)
VPKVGLLWRAEWDPPQTGSPVAESCRLKGVFAAFGALGVPARPLIYADDRVDTIRAQLLDLDGVLVWVNPVERGVDRSKLDALLREVSDAGVWVSAHPDVIQRLATKRVLFDTRELSWGSDTRLYRSAAELREGLPVRLADGTARVLKQQRGMGGQGVWKVERDTPADDARLRVQHATRDAPSERLRLTEFVARCEPYFEAGGLIVEQPFQERIDEGMIRVYLSHDAVVGFAHQYPAGLRPERAGEPPPGKRFEPARASGYQGLRELMECEWVPQMQQLLDLDAHALPVIWDADFLYGPKTASGEDTYVLCEINASSTFAFPEHAMPTVAQAALDRLAAHRRRRR